VTEHANRDTSVRRRRSPLLSVLPRREIGAPAPGMIVKLRTTIHRRKRDPLPRAFHQLTVPADIAEQIEPDAPFRVSFDGDRLVYELVRR